MNGHLQQVTPIVPSEIIRAIEEILVYFGREDSWMVFKKELLKTLNPKHRRGFSLRDPKTKQNSINTFERTIIEYWRELTGVQLVLKD